MKGYPPPMKGYPSMHNPGAAQGYHPGAAPYTVHHNKGPHKGAPQPGHEIHKGYEKMHKGYPPQTPPLYKSGPEKGKGGAPPAGFGFEKGYTPVKKGYPTEGKGMHQLPPGFEGKSHEKGYPGAKGHHPHVDAKGQQMVPVDGKGHPIVSPMEKGGKQVVYKGGLPPGHPEASGHPGAAHVMHKGAPVHSGAVIHKGAPPPTPLHQPGAPPPGAQILHHGPPPSGHHLGAPPPGAQILHHGPPPSGHHPGAPPHHNGALPPTALIHQGPPPPGAVIVKGAPPGSIIPPPGHTLEITRNPDGSETRTIKMLPPVPGQPNVAGQPSAPTPAAPQGSTTAPLKGGRGPPPTTFNNGAASADGKGTSSGKSDGGQASGGKPDGDFADRRPDVYNYFREKNVVKSGEGLLSIMLYNGMCRDKHVDDFMDCLESWLKRNLGEKPYHLCQFDISNNDLQDKSIQTIMETLLQLEVRIDILNLSKNRVGKEASAKISEYIWLSDPLAQLSLSNCNLSEEDLNAILRACYNHNSYPRRNSSMMPVPFRLDILGNPVVNNGRMHELLNGIRKQGGKERVWFCNGETLEEKELVKYRAKLDQCYLAVHMPLAWAGSDDRKKKKRKRKESTSDSSAEDAKA